MHSMESIMVCYLLFIFYLILVPFVSKSSCRLQLIILDAVCYIS